MYVHVSRNERWNDICVVYNYYALDLDSENSTITVAALTYYKYVSRETVEKIIRDIRRRRSVEVLNFLIFFFSFGDGLFEL